MESGIVPSYLTKLGRAERALSELQTEVERFANSHPYEVRESTAGRKRRKLRRVFFTASPANTEIPIVTADLIYNLRSSLDHLMSALVANKDRGSVMFPIFFTGVWDPGAPGENKQRTKARQRWASDTKTVKPEALAILKRLQPPDDPSQKEAPDILPLLNQLSNRDRHEKLPKVEPGLSRIEIRFTEPDGTEGQGEGVIHPHHVLNDGAEITNLPKGVTDVTVRGVPVVGIAVGSIRHVEIPDRLHDVLEFVRSEVVAPLVPYVQR